MKIIAAVSLIALLMISWSVFPGDEQLTAKKTMSALKISDEAVLVFEGPGKTKRGQAAVSFGGDNYLVVWQEGWHGKGGSSRIHALRVAPNGKPLDPGGIEIAPCKTGVQENPRVAFSQGIFLVVWQDMRNGTDSDVLGMRISTQGKVLDESPLAIAVGARSQVMPDVVADEKGFMVVWHGYQGDELFPQVFGARVNADGSMGLPQVVTGGADPRLAWNGKEFFLAYSTFVGKNCKQVIAWLRMDAAGKPLPRKGTWYVYGICEYSVCALPDGNGWLIVVHQNAPNFWGRGVGAHRLINITPEGTLAPDSPTAKTKQYVEGTKAPNFLDTSKNHPDLWPYGRNAIVPAGKYCVVVWQRYRLGGSNGISMSNGDIRAGRADRWKPLDGEGGIAVAESDDSEIDPALASDRAGNLLCVYQKVVRGRSEIVARAIRSE